MVKNGGEPAIDARNLASWRMPNDDNTLTAGRFWLIVGLFSLIAIAFQLFFFYPNATDYVGPDPDDAMRLVEVRDYLNGQGWFDLTQYRLGPDGGTLMHWSRLVDWPIAMLISGFSLFLTPQAAEAAALAVWPLLLIFPLLASVGLASYRIGGKGALIIGLLLSVVFLAAVLRFRPGAIDHHNVQLVLATFIAAMLIDPVARASNFAAAAVAGGLALAIGVETTPMIAVSAMTVAVLWSLDGERYRNAAIGFGLTFAIATSIIFMGTTPVRLISAVTCDTLSFGYFSLVAIGGLALAIAAFAASTKSRIARFISLIGIGALVLLTAVVIAPQCLHNPLDDLDPLLQSMWINSITEAQSMLDTMMFKPQNIGGFYAVGLIALAVCVFRLARGEQRAAYAILLVLIGINWAVSTFQIRGVFFANFLAFIPLSALIADLRDLYRSRQKDARAATAFILSALASVPTVWAIGGELAFDAGNAIAGISYSNRTREDEEKVNACVTEETMRNFARMTPGRILSSTNPGAALLRFTPHSVLTANYHRNQAGMIAALRMQMAKPLDALPMLERQKIAYVLICTNDPQIAVMKKDYPKGLFARLAGDDIPGYLEELPQSGNSALRIYQIIQR